MKTEEIQPETLREYSSRIDSIGVVIASRRLEAPVLFFLEMHRPLSTIASTFLTCGGPILVGLIGKQWIDTIRILLENPSEIERLMKNLETGVYSGAEYGRT